MQYWTQQRAIYANTEIENGLLCGKFIFRNTGIWTDVEMRNKGMKEIEAKIEKDQAGAGESWQQVFDGTQRFLNEIGGLLEEKRLSKVLLCKSSIDAILRQIKAAESNAEVCFGSAGHMRSDR